MTKPRVHWLFSGKGWLNGGTLFQAIAADRPTAFAARPPASIREPPKAVSAALWWFLGRTIWGMASAAFPAPRAAYLGRLRMSAIWVGAQPYMRASGLALSTLRDRRL